MPTQLPFFGRKAELQLLHDAWRAATTTREPQIVTLVAETGVGKSRIIQEFYHQLTVSETWDPSNFWPDAFQSHATQ
jgi:predicted ATPase